jgi:peptide/nickel transport system ATP-binding protein
MIDASLRATVLDTLRRLNRELGISLVYITHDLTTAYQISSDIIVLYSGTVAEAGAVESVVKNPQHPYTQLLVSSIPLPNPELPWSDEPEPSAIGLNAKPGIGCPFAARCPYAFARCLEEAPPLYHIQPQQAATCYLYQDRPTLPWENMDSIFAKVQAPAIEPRTRAEKEVTSPYR